MILYDPVDIGRWVYLLPINNLQFIIFKDGVEWFV
jgi:hypothetical protein